MAGLATKTMELKKRFKLGVVLVLVALWIGGCSSEPEKPQTDSQSSPKPQPSIAEAKPEVPSGGEQSGDENTSRSWIGKNLSGRDANRKAHAILAAGFWKATEYLADIQLALEDKDPKVQKAAVDALVSFEDRDSVVKLYELFQTARNNRSVQESILKAFEKIHDDKTIGFLESLLGKLDPNLSNLTVDVLRAIRPIRKPSGESGRQGIESFTISGLMNSGNEAKIQVGGKFFASGDTISGFLIKDIDTAKQLVTLEKDGESFTKGVDTGNQDEVEKAIEATQGSDDAEVYKSLIKLARFRDSRGSAEIVSLINGNNVDNIKLGAIFTAGMCGITDAVQPLGDILNREKRVDFLILAIDALVRIGDERSIDLLMGIRNRNPWIQNSVIAGLGTFASEVGLATIVAGLFDDFGFVRSNSYHQAKQLTDLGMGSEILSLLSSLSFSQKKTLESDRLAEYLSSVVQPEQGGSEKNPFVMGPGDGKTQEPKAPQQYKPKFIIVNIGNWFGKNAVTVIEQGETRKVYEGGVIEGMSVLKVDPDESLVHLKLPSGKTALVEKTDESSPAQIYEIQ